MPAEWVEGESGVWTCKEHVLETKFRPLEAALGVKVVDDPARVLRFTISDQAPDRSNDRMNQKGMITTDYERSPLVYFQHAPRFDPTAKPIARTLKIKKERGEVPFTWADALYAGDEQRHEEAELCYRLARDGFITSASVGFVPLERKDLPPKDRKQGGYPGFEILSWDLREWSNVGIPDNVRATRHPGVAPSKGWDVARLRDVAREFIEGSRLDAFVKSFTGEETIEVTTVPATPPTPRTNDLPDMGFDHWQKWVGKAAPRWEAGSTGAKAAMKKGDRVRVRSGAAHDEMHADMTGEIVEVSTAALAVRFGDMKDVHRWYVESELRAVEPDEDEMEKSVPRRTASPSRVAEVTIDTSKADTSLDALTARVGALDAAVDAALAKAAALPQASVQAAPGDDALKSWLTDQLTEQRRHFDYALAELFGFTERKQEAALKAARATPRDPAAVPVSAEKGASPPSSSSNGAGTNGAQPPLDGAALVRAVAAARQLDRERRTGVVR